MVCGCALFWAVSKAHLLIELDSSAPRGQCCVAHAFSFVRQAVQDGWQDFAQVLLQTAKVAACHTAASN